MWFRLGAFCVGIAALVLDLRELEPVAWCVVAAAVGYEAGRGRADQALAASFVALHAEERRLNAEAQSLRQELAESVAGSMLDRAALERARRDADELRAELAADPPPSGLPVGVFVRIMPPRDGRKAGRYLLVYDRSRVVYADEEESEESASA